MKNNKISPIMLIIMDGFGYSKSNKGNAISHAKMPNFNNWLTKYPHRLLKASGPAVGLPKGYMGNSEVGHMTIGTGRITQTVLAKFFEAIKDKSFFENKILKQNLNILKREDKTLHLMGLLSDAGVHSHQEHLYAFLKFAKKNTKYRTGKHSGLRVKNFCFAVLWDFWNM